MDLSNLENLTPFAIALLIGGAAAWLSYRHKIAFAVILFVVFIGLGFLGKNLMPSMSLKGMSPSEMPAAIWSGFTDMTQKMILLTLAAAIIFRLLLAALFHAARRKGPESRRDMRTRLYKDFSYEDSLTEAMQSGKRTVLDEVVPWANRSASQTTGQGTRKDNRSRV